MTDVAKRQAPESGEGSQADADRKAAVLALATEVRALVDATVRSGVAVDVLQSVATHVRTLTDQLAAVVHDNAHSGLLGEIDMSNPDTYMFLTPMAGQYNPIAPPMQVYPDADRVRGTVVLGRQHTGPPGYGHGGSLASICDHLVGIAAWSAGLRAFTKNLRVSFLRPVPHDCVVDLQAWIADRTDGGAHAHAEISRAGKILVTAESDLVVATYRAPSPSELRG